VCAGRISRQKAQDLLVDVWPKVAAAVPNAQLALVGRVEQPLRSLPPGVRVWPERDDPVDWYAAADVVVVPSRWEAGLPLVAREAMACGRCVLISNLDVMTDDFPPGVGAVVPVDDANAWTDVIASRLADRDTTDREGRAGGEHAASRFGLATAADRMHDIYLQAQSARRQ
jgi:glycosyltransferase involved in cell wall biosynthesis